MFIAKSPVKYDRNAVFVFNTIDRYLNKHDLFKSSVLPVHGCDAVLHTTPAEFLMQTITVCGPHY